MAVPTTATDVSQRPVMTRQEILEILPVNETTLWRWVRDRKFPQPLNYNHQGRQLWRKSDVEKWLGESL
jgi:predicted DNA-binding transcriptional regulator AlpA